MCPTQKKNLGSNEEKSEGHINTSPHSTTEQNVFYLSVVQTH